MAPSAMGDNDFLEAEDLQGKLQHHSAATLQGKCKHWVIFLKIPFLRFDYCLDGDAFKSQTTPSFISDSSAGIRN